MIRLARAGFYYTSQSSETKCFSCGIHDDTVIFAESAEDLQAALNIFEEYCSEWKLFINVSKTKIVVFSKRKYNNKREFLLNDEEVEVKDSYT
jgi:hypothetical protein